MKNKISSIFALVCTMFCVCSCAQNFNDYVKDFAIESYNDKNADVNYQVEDSIKEVVGEYVRDSTYSFRPIYNSSLIREDNLKQFFVGSNPFYVGANNNIIYDSFGDSYVLNYSYLDIDYSLKKIVVAYEKYPQITSTMLKKEKIGLLDVLDIYPRTSYGSHLYLFKDTLDNRYRLSWSENSISNKYLFDFNDYFEQISDTEFLVIDDSYRYEFTYSYNSLQSYSNIRCEKKLIISDSYTTLKSLNFVNFNSYVFSIKPVDEITNDFSFVADGKKYIAKINDLLLIGDKKCNYIPIDYKMSKNKYYAMILYKKVDDDGNISNHFYAGKLFPASPLKINSETTDIERYFDLSRSFSYCDDIYTLNKDEKIVSASNFKWLICLNDSSILCRDNDGVLEKVPTSNAVSINKSPVNNTFGFYSSESGRLNFVKISTEDSKTIFTSSSILAKNINVINPTICLYLLPNKLMLLDEELFSNSDGIDVNLIYKYEITTLGKTVGRYCYSVKCNNVTKILKLSFSLH